jgi:hypothetical protein
LKIWIDGNEYIIKSANYLEPIIVEGTVPTPTVREFTLQNPFYFHATPMKMNNHLSMIKKSDEKFPFIYLVEIVRERFSNEPDALIDRNADLMLLFLDESNKKDWLTDDHYSKVIYRMRSLVKYFIEQMELDSGFGEIRDFEISNHAEYGIYQNYKGHTETIFNETLSGAELRIDVPITKNLLCST